MPTLLLIDGSNYLFRAFHALPPLTTRNGEPTGAIKGFHGMLRTIRNLVNPDYAACVFDAPGKNFRHAIYPDYKANRPPMPDELRVQIEPIFELVKMQGWPLLQIDAVEADDVLATLAKRAEALGWDVVIATGDKDLAQMVNERVSLVNTMTRVKYDPAGVIERYGVRPEQIIDYLALMGDKVDNVPGIDKCGPKTAAKWLQAYGTLDGVIANAGSITGKVGEYLRQGIPFLSVARRLVTINSDLPLDVPVQSLVFSDPDEKKLAAFFERWQMSGARPVPAAKKTPAAPAAAAPQADLFSGLGMPVDAVQDSRAALSHQEGDFSLVDSTAALDALAQRLAARSVSAPAVAVTFLTDPVSPMTDTPVGLALAMSPLETVYLPLNHRTGTNLTAEDLLGRLGPWFSGPAPKLFHDSKYARHVLQNIGLTVGKVTHDTMLMSYVIEAHLRHDLDKLAARYCSTLLTSEEELVGKGAARQSVQSLTVRSAGSFLCSQAAALRALGSVLLCQLESDPGLVHIYHAIELPVAQVLWTMERTGVTIDANRLREQSSELTAQIHTLEEQIMEQAGEKFNPASPKQLGYILFEKLQIPTKKRTASGGYSTAEEVLSELALDYPLPKLILQYRQLAKLKSTYTDKLPLMVNAQDGRVHTTFGQATAVTGRLASSEPNLQNIPVRTPEGRRVREAFVAPAGCKIISADYSQIELRIMAHISGDPGLLRAFHERLDIHRATAAEVFGVALGEVTADQRRMAKVINFGLIYGMSPFGLAQNLGVERSVATHYIGEYFARYPLVRQYMENTRQQARHDGFVQTAFGRRLWLPDLLSPKAAIRAGAERAAINAPMQGTAADLIKMAMIAVMQWLSDEHLQSRLVLQVHDELILEVPLAEVETVKKRLPELMAQAAQLSVPLLAEVGVADNWEEAH